MARATCKQISFGTGRAIWAMTWEIAWNRRSATHPMRWNRLSKYLSFNFSECPHSAINRLQQGELQVNQNETLKSKHHFGGLLKGSPRPTVGVSHDKLSWHHHDSDFSPCGCNLPLVFGEGRLWKLKSPASLWETRLPAASSQAKQTVVTLRETRERKAKYGAATAIQPLEEIASPRACGYLP